VAKAGSLNDVLAFLKAQDLRFVAAEGTKPAEQVPMALLPKLSGIKDGQFLVFPNTGVSTVTYVAGSQNAPLTEQQATPYIEQYLQNEERKKIAAQEMKDLRASAKIEYVGEFANRDTAAVPEAASTVASGSKGAEATSAVPNDSKGSNNTSDDFVGRGISGMS
jgi:hypothetical protein